MTGGDLTIDDGEYCSRCREADALHCMAVGPCDRRDLARTMDALAKGLLKFGERPTTEQLRASAKCLLSALGRK